MNSATGGEQVADLWQRCLMQQSSGSGDIILFDSASGEGQGQAAVIGAWGISAISDLASHISLAAPARPGCC